MCLCLCKQTFALQENASCFVLCNNIAIIGTKNAAIYTMDLEHRKFKPFVSTRKSARKSLLSDYIMNRSSSLLKPSKIHIIEQADSFFKIKFEEMANDIAN